MKQNSAPYRVGLIGFGNIGSGLVRHLVEHRDLIAARLGRPLELVEIADKEFDRPRDVTPPPSVRLTTNWRELATSPEIDGVVELVGVGADGKPTLALDIAKTVLGAGKDFVTANKGLIAPHGAELHALAAKSGALCLYEASVGAGIPLIGAMQLSLAGNEFNAIHGIVNGTCNYILTNIDRDPALTMDAAVADAQRLGYAEPDPTFDVEGHDTAYKIVILASLAFGQRFRFEDVRLDGITKLGAPEFEYARKSGHSLKLMASAIRRAGGVELIVGPAFVPNDHVVAGVRGVFNTVLIQADPIGDTLYYGRGAGQGSTGSGLVADLMLAARTRSGGAANPYPLSIPDIAARVAVPGECVAKRYLRVGGSAASVSAAKGVGLPGNVVSEGPGHVAVVADDLTVAECDKALGKLTAAGVSLREIVIGRFPFPAS